MLAREKVTSTPADLEIAQGAIRSRLSKLADKVEHNYDTATINLKLTQNMSSKFMEKLTGLR